MQVRLTEGLTKLLHVYRQIWSYWHLYWRTVKTGQFKASLNWSQFTQNTSHLVVLNLLECSPVTLGEWWIWGASSIQMILQFNRRQITGLHCLHQKLDSVLIKPCLFGFWRYVLTCLKIRGRFSFQICLSRSSWKVSWSFMVLFGDETVLNNRDHFFCLTILLFIPSFHRALFLSLSFYITAYRKQRAFRKSLKNTLLCIMQLMFCNHRFTVNMYIFRQICTVAVAWFT